MSRLSVSLTPFQAEVASWALGAMEDYWGAPPGEPVDPKSDGVVENEFTLPADEPRVPYIVGTRLILSSWNEVNDDLAYRVGEQHLDMLDDQLDGAEITDGQCRGRKTSCRKLAAAIKRVSP